MEILEELGRKVNLQGKEVFLCTDNMVLESIATTGSSKSEALFDLLVRLHCMSMRFKCNVRFIHVAGTRMSSQGTDGLSRGDMYEEIMKGGNNYFLPPAGKIIPGQVSQSEQVDQRVGLNTREGCGGVRASWMV